MDYNLLNVVTSKSEFAAMFLLRKKKYHGTNKEIAKKWRDCVVSELNWTKSENQVGAKDGEAGGYYVQAQGFPRRGYMKPTKPHEGAARSARAAREKIASDLAHDLGLPLPPAVLATRSDTPPGCEATVVVTLVMYPAQHYWEQVKAQALPEGPGGLALASVYSQCSPMLPFNTWVRQMDHGDHPNNIIWGYDPQNLADSQLIFLDYSYSLGHDNSWNGDGWKQITWSPFPQALQTHMDDDKLIEAAARIAGYDPKRVDEIVRRIPDNYLDGAQKDNIVTSLIGRMPLVMRAMEQNLAEGRSGG